MVDVTRVSTDIISHLTDVALTQYVNKTISIRVNGGDYLAMGLFKGWAWKIIPAERDRYGRQSLPVRPQLVFIFDGYEMPFPGDSNYLTRQQLVIEEWALTNGLA